MDHAAAPSPAELVRPWRTATLVLTGIAAAELVLLLGAGAILLGRELAPRVAGSHAAKKAKVVKVQHVPVRVPKPQPIGVPKLSRRHTTVLVLNGNGRPGAAGVEARLVRAKGYPISHVGNAQRSDYPRSLVMYRPGYRAEGFRLAHDLHIRVVTPLDGVRPRGLGRARAAVIVGG